MHVLDVARASSRRSGHSVWLAVRYVPKADIRQRGVLTNPRGGQADIDWSLLHVERTHTMRAKLFLDGWSLQ